MRIVGFRPRKKGESRINRLSLTALPQRGHIGKEGDLWVNTGSNLTKKVCPYRKVRKNNTDEGEEGIGEKTEKPIPDLPSSPPLKSRQRKKWEFASTGESENCGPFIS